ncbi:MAG TPA: sugar phosphate isomerase/epimerase family protein [Candidatus Acidoferrum sp.]|nr:sugar phosphate isomerase/epimerase family protein [Candidatus Acidoferrum sp.]
MKPCLNQDTLRKTPFDKFLSIAKRTGFEAIEFTVDKIDPILETDETTKLRTKIEEERLKIASINGPENFNLLTDRDFSDLLTRTKKLSSFATTLNCDLLLPVPATNQSGVSKAVVIERTVQCLEKLSDVCGEEIRLGLEFLGMHNCSINNLKDGMEVVRRVGRSNVGLTLDSFHSYLSGEDFAEIAKLDREEIFMVHVNDCERGLRENMTDANRLFPGEGAIDLEDFLAHVRKVGYDDYVSLELLRPAYWDRDPEEIAVIGRESLKRFNI